MTEEPNPPNPPRGERGRREGNFKEEFLGAGVGDEVNRRSKPSTHLCFNLEAGGEIPVEKAVHWGRREAIVGLNPRIAIVVARGGEERGRHRPSVVNFSVERN